jgi:hypothetical protein
VPVDLRRVPQGKFGDTIAGGVTVLGNDWIWGAIPEGFKKIAAGNKRQMVVREDMASIVRFGMCAAADPVVEVSQFQGRVGLKSIALCNGDTALIRAYHHGGLLRGATGGVFFTWPPRPFRELAITEGLRRRGVPTVEVYGACIARIWGPLYRGWLITRELKGAVDLWAACQNGLVAEKGGETILHPVAGTLRVLHREGVYHRDLNLKNILVRVEPEGVKGYIIDFDRARLFLGGVPTQFAARNLARLLRSVCKLDPERKYFTKSDWDRFIAWYHDADRNES